MNIFEESEGRLHSRDILNPTLVSSSRTGPVGCRPLRFNLSVRLSAIIGMTNGSRILQLFLYAASFLCLCETAKNVNILVFQNKGDNLK